MSTTPNEREAFEAEVALIEKTALHVGMKSLMNHGAASCVYTEGCNGVSQEHLIAFAREVALHCVAALAAARSSLPPSDHIGDGNKMVGVSAALISKLTVASVVIGNLPQLPGYNGSILTIDDTEAEKIASDLDEVCAALAAAGAKPEPEGEAVAEVLCGHHGSYVRWLSPHPLPAGTLLYAPIPVPDSGRAEAQPDEQVGERLQDGLEKALRDDGYEFAHQGRSVCDWVDGIAKALASPAQQQPVSAEAINYVPLHEYADKHRVPYNALCAAVHDAVRTQAGQTELSKAAVPADAPPKLWTRYAGADGEWWSRAGFEARKSRGQWQLSKHGRPIARDEFLQAVMQFADEIAALSTQHAEQGKDGAA